MGSVEDSTADLVGGTQKLAQTYNSSVSQIVNFGNSLNRLYTTQVNMTQQLSAAGQSITAYNRQLTELNKTTNLSRSDTASFFTQLVEVQQGLKNLSALKEVQQNISAIGITSENSAKHLNTFAAAQQRVFDLDEKIARKESLNVSERMRLTQEQRALYDNMLNYSRVGLADGDPAMRRQLEMTQKLNKEWENASLRLKESFLPVIQTISAVMLGITKYVQKIGEGLGPALKGFESLGKFSPHSPGGSGENGTGTDLFSLGIMGFAGMKGISYLRNRHGGGGGGGGGGFDFDEAKSAFDPIDESTFTPDELKKEQKRRTKLRRQFKIRRATRIGGIGSIAAMAAAPIVSSLYDNYVSDGVSEDADKNIRSAGNIALGTIGAASTGALIGSVIPGVGTVVGGALGAAYGLYSGLTADGEDPSKSAVPQVTPTDMEAAQAQKREEQRKQVLEGMISGRVSGRDARQQLVQISQDDLKAREMYYRNRGEIEHAEKLRKLHEDGRASQSAATEGMLEGLEQAQVAMDQFANATNGAAQSYQQLSDLAAKWSFDGGQAAKFLGEKYELMQSQLPLMQDLLRTHRVMTQQAESELQAAIANNASIEERERLQESVVMVRANEAKVANQLRMHEIELAKTRHDQMLADVSVQKELNSVSQEYADAQKELTEQLRMGFGASFETIRKSIQVRGEGVKIAEMEVAKWKEIAASAKTAEERQYAMVQLSKSQTDLMKKQAGYMKEINDLRTGYIDSLGELSLGGLSSEFNPTGDSGIVHFMGMGRNKGGSSIGGVGGPEGRHDYAAQMGRSGQIIPGFEGNNLDTYAYDRAIIGRLGPIASQARSGLGYKNPTGDNLNIGNAMGQGHGPMGGRVGAPPPGASGAAVIGPGGQVMQIRAFADGGIVNKPTLSLSGEAGPEAYVPLKGGKIPVQVHHFSKEGQAMRANIDHSSGFAFDVVKAIDNGFSRAVDAIGTDLPHAIMSAPGKGWENLNNWFSDMPERMGFGASRKGTAQLGDRFEHGVPKPSTGPKDIMSAMMGYQKRLDAIDVNGPNQKEALKELNQWQSEFRDFATKNIPGYAEMVSGMERDSLNDRMRQDYYSSMNFAGSERSMSRHRRGRNVSMPKNTALEAFSKRMSEARKIDDYFANDHISNRAPHAEQAFIPMSAKPIGAPKTSQQEVVHTVNVNGNCTSCGTKHTVQKLSGALGKATVHNMTT